MKKHHYIIGGICIALCSLSALFLSGCDQPVYEQVCEHPYLTEQIISPTCDQEGHTVHTCTDCSYEYITNIIAPTGHGMESIETAPTCEAQGYTTYRCTACEYSYVADYVAPLDHQLTTETLNATCERVGYIKRHCELCDYQDSHELTPLPHTFTTTSVRATCLQSGYTEHQCTLCSYNYKIYLHYSDLLPSAYVENTEVLAQGLDVSKYNHEKDSSGNYLPLDWAAIKNAGFDYVILKIGSTPRNDGTLGGLEPTFEADYAAAKAAGLDIGVYFFTYATSVEQNIADAELGAQWLTGKKLEYPVYYDIENHSFDTDTEDSIDPILPDRNTLTDFCVAFISRLQEKGFYCGLYCNRDWLENHLDTARCTLLFDIWYARYRDITNPYPADALFTWTYGDQLGMWQYACTGKIDGFDHFNFDFNYAYKDFPAIMQQFHLNGY